MDNTMIISELRLERVGNMDLKGLAKDIVRKNILQGIREYGNNDFSIKFPLGESVNLEFMRNAIDEVMEEVDIYYATEGYNIIYSELYHGLKEIQINVCMPKTVRGFLF